MNWPYIKRRLETLGCRGETTMMIAPGADEKELSFTFCDGRCRGWTILAQGELWYGRMARDGTFGEDFDSAMDEAISWLDKLGRGDLADFVRRLSADMEEVEAS